MKRRILILALALALCLALAAPAAAMTPEEAIKAVELTFDQVEDVMTPISFFFHRGEYASLPGYASIAAGTTVNVENLGLANADCYLYIALTPFRAFTKEEYLDLFGDPELVNGERFAALAPGDRFYSMAEDTSSVILTEENGEQVWVPYTGAEPEKTLRLLKGQRASFQITTNSTGVYDNDFWLLSVNIVLDTQETNAEVLLMQVDPVVGPTSQNLSVDGSARTTEIYNIDGANFFKLRDIAALLNGTVSQFSVGWDDASKTISVKTGAAYQLQPGDLAQVDAATARQKAAGAVRSRQRLLINGQQISLAAYNIGGNNFFKLRDLADALGFDVGWDGATRTMTVTSR